MPVCSGVCNLSSDADFIPEFWPSKCPIQVGPAMRRWQSQDSPDCFTQNFRILQVYGIWLFVATPTASTQTVKFAIWSHFSLLTSCLIGGTLCCFFHCSDQHKIYPGTPREMITFSTALGVTGIHGEAILVLGSLRLGSQGRCRHTLYSDSYTKNAHGSQNQKEWLS